MSFLNATTPDELRAAVAQIDPLASLQIDFEQAALAEAREFVSDRRSPNAEWRRFTRDHDPFFDDALANVELGIDGMPDPGRAVLVLSSPGALTDTDGERFWMHATDLTRPSVTSAGRPCHRCLESSRVSSDAVAPKPAQYFFHAATGRFVVEFALCADCIGFYESMADQIRVYSADRTTYIEFYNE